MRDGVFRTAQNAHPSDRQVAIQIRQRLSKHGNLLLESQNNAALGDAYHTRVQESLELLESLIGDDNNNAGYLQPVLTLISLVCMKHVLFSAEFGRQKMLNTYIALGDFLLQLATSASRLSLLKSDAVERCEAVCNAIHSTSISSSQIDTFAEVRLEEFKKLVHPCAGSLLVSTTVFELLKLIDVTNDSRFQTSLNLAISGVLNFLCVRVRNIFTKHNLSPGVDSPAHSRSSLDSGEPVCE
jgi:hypothetical protein